MPCPGCCSPRKVPGSTIWTLHFGHVTSLLDLFFIWTNSPRVQIDVTAPLLFIKVQSALLYSLHPSFFFSLSLAWKYSITISFWKIGHHFLKSHNLRLITDTSSLIHHTFNSILVIIMHCWTLALEFYSQQQAISPRTWTNLLTWVTANNWQAWGMQTQFINSRRLESKSVLPTKQPSCTTLGYR